MSSHLIHNIIGKITDKKSAIVLLAAAASFCVSPLPAQQSQNSPSSPTQGHDSMPGMDMSQHDSDKNPDAAKAANDAMSDHDMDEMSAHMYMTDVAPRESRPMKSAPTKYLRSCGPPSKNTRTIASLSPTASRFSCPTFRSRTITSRIMRTALEASL